MGFSRLLILILTSCHYILSVVVLECMALLEVAQVLVLGSELFEVVRVHDDVHA